MVILDSHNDDEGLTVTMPSTLEENQQAISTTPTAIPQLGRARSRRSVALYIPTLQSPPASAGGRRWYTKGSIATDIELFDLLAKLSDTPSVSVQIARDKLTENTVAMKTVVLNGWMLNRRQRLLAELQILHECKSKFIIPFLGAFVPGQELHLCTELMDLGSFEQIYTSHGPIEIGIIGVVAESVLEALSYMHNVHRLIHKDIQPSNIYCNTHGDIKIHAFALSQEHLYTIVDDVVPTSTYNSPEQIKGGPSTIKSDVWSLGISLIELAIGRFPFSEPEGQHTTSHDDLIDYYFMTRDDIEPESSTAADSSNQPGDSSQAIHSSRGKMKMSILELLQHIVDEPPPKLQLVGETKFPKEADEFVNWCLIKDPELRPLPEPLLAHPWMRNTKALHVDVREWAQLL